MKGALLLSLACATPAAAQQYDVYREVSIVPHGRIILGEPFALRGVVTVPLGDGLLRLPPGYGDTRAIVVQLDGDGLVRGLRFDYVEGKSFDTARAVYQGELGAPASSDSVDSAGVRTRSVVWQDADTEFALISREHPDSSAEVFSVLEDRRGGDSSVLRRLRVPRPPRTGRVPPARSGRAPGGSRGGGTRPSSR